MSERKSDGKQQLRKQPRMRRVESASSTSLPNLSVPKTARQRKFRNSTQRIRRPLSSVRAFVLNSRWFSVVIVALAIYTLYLIGSDERFYLSYIPVEGSSTIEINDIVAESGLAGSHIFAADPQEAADKISRIGGVITSTVTLHWPNEVMIRIREKPPLATWQEGETLYWIDADGHLTNARAQTVGLLNIISEIPPPVAQAQPASLQDGDRITAAEEAEGATAEEDTEAVDGEAGEDTVNSQAAFVPREVLAGALQLRELRPNIDKLYYKPSDGLGYQDGRGWTAYFGTGRDMHQKLVVYETIVADLLERGARPAYISVANQHKPYYRLAQ